MTRKRGNISRPGAAVMVKWLTAAPQRKGAEQDLGRTSETDKNVGTINIKKSQKVESKKECFTTESMNAVEPPD